MFKNVLMKLFSVFFLAGAFISFTPSFAVTELMTFDDFLFDIKEMVGKEVNVQVPVRGVDLAKRTAHVDFEYVSLNLEAIEKKKIKNMRSLCEVGNCWVDVKGKLIKNPDGYPTYLIKAESTSLWFLVGVVVSENGWAHIGFNENLAVNQNVQTTGGESYLSGEIWIDSPGTVAIGYGKDLTNFYMSYEFNEDETKAKDSALELCNGQIPKLVRLSVKCTALLFDVPWW